ncbi:MAG: hypothetical protein K2Y42_16915 [Hyphomicrobium sp.]|jgi:hypothetical protein|uniref:hypothetical protein n=1 Tax=Hyphomicrobium sp. TaxID=82 RepID=UPI0025BA0434|nr:hypothetical protein [Hyphomicrobium sp.]MBX9864423.1 hypothetical protein [Hyphomicrobium sp.]
MSKTKASFYVYGAPISFLVECFRYRMARRVLSLSLPTGHSAEVIQLSEWRASRALPN